MRLESLEIRHIFAILCQESSRVHGLVCSVFLPSKEICENPFAGLGGPTILSRNSLIAQQLPASWRAGNPYFSTVLGIVCPISCLKQALIIYNHWIENASIIFHFFWFFSNFFLGRKSLVFTGVSGLLTRKSCMMFMHTCSGVSCNVHLLCSLTRKPLNMGVFQPSPLPGKPLNMEYFSRPLFPGGLGSYSAEQ